MTAFFNSRRVEPPEGLGELSPAALPAGYRACGVAAGISASGLDLGVLLAERSETAPATRFTANVDANAGNGPDPLCPEREYAAGPHSAPDKVSPAGLETHAE